MALTNSELLIRGLPGETLNPDNVVASGYQSILLYPADDSIDFTHDFAATLKKPVNIIVPDGNWRQASKVMNRESYLAGLPRIKIPAHDPTQYRLRRETKAGGLATFEAISRAVGIIEGPEVQGQMERFFHIMVERLLWGRGQMRADECLEEIPKKALN